VDIVQARMRDSDPPRVLEPDASTAAASTLQATESAPNPRPQIPPNVKIESTRATVEHYEVGSENGGPD
jgi:hypothetical protein